VPEDITFHSRPDYALEMLEHAWQEGVPRPWVAGHEVCGDAPYLREGIAAHERLYVVAVSGHTPIWLHPPPGREPTTAAGGRGRSPVRLAEHAPRPTTVTAAVCSSFQPEEKSGSAVSCASNWACPTNPWPKRCEPFCQPWRPVSR
jgi:SRSO17 transposase